MIRKNILIAILIRFKSAILAKTILFKPYENAKKISFCIMTQGTPNPGFMQEKVQKSDFLKKPSRKLKNIFCFRFE